MLFTAIQWPGFCAAVFMFVKISILSAEYQPRWVFVWTDASIVLNKWSLSKKLFYHGLFIVPKSTDKTYSFDELQIKKEFFISWDC